MMAPIMLDSRMAKVFKYYDIQRISCPSAIWNPIPIYLEEFFPLRDLQPQW
jgi:hypothetical protein